ncbi:MAG: hypothetical protein KF794_12395 [Xanthobacteraceae bacterium]|nr:hypothetical protein [Xanthobacteraceae bacterium]QYK44560.1 MAG: hypothetical protein KF794_12395 [Xanthobacteraceae bacterium]
MKTVRLPVPAFILAIATGVVLWPSAGNAQEIFGCWETDRNADEARKICINRDLDLDQVTFHSRGDSGSCDYYPVVRGVREGVIYVFTVPPGTDNCTDHHGRRTGSVPGTMRCQVMDEKRMACETAWLGYDTIQQIYYRK